MQLKEVMTPNVELVDADMTLYEAARKMKAMDVGFLPVRDAEEGLCGVVTDRDIVVRGVAEQQDPGRTWVSQVMTEQALSMPQDTAIREAVASMEQQQFRRLLVCDESGELVGVVSLGDLAMRVSQELGGEALQQVSDPTKPDRVAGTA